MDFLDRKQKVVIPVGGDFVPTGFIAQWQAAVMTSFMTEVNLKDEGIAFSAARQVGQSGYTRYYWHDYQAAVEAAESVGQQYKPQTLWVFEAQTDSVLNFVDESTKDKFGPQITYDGCRIVTLRSKKYRHELHLIALPAAVQAYAKMQGWAVPELDFSELTSQDTAFTDDFQAEMIGHPDQDDWESSVLGQYRAKLWKALGEDNATAYKLAGSGTKFDATEGSKLDEALGILHYSWTQPIWARLIPVPDPRVDAVYTSGDDQVKRLSIPALMDIFASKEAAQAAAEADKVGDSSSSATTAATEGPAVPSDWADFPDDWKSIVKEEKAKGPKPKVMRDLKAEEAAGTLHDRILASASDVEAWWDLVA